MRNQGINTECRMMRAVSSHRDLRGSKMRFLVVSAFLACAAAAPSHLLAPVAVPVAAVPAVPVAYSALPTLSPGDIQAAAIDAQVKAQDLAIAAVDKARELSDLAAKDLVEKSIVSNDAVKENTEESFWSAQEKQWQVLDALKTAEAQLDGALASNAPVLAKSIVGAPLVAGVVPAAPIVYTPGIIAPVVKTVKEEAKAEEPKPEMNEPLVKSAEETKEDKDSVTIEASTKNLEAKPQIAPVVAPLAIQPYYSHGYPIVAPVALSPVLKYSAWPQIGLAPAIVNSGW